MPPNVTSLGTVKPGIPIQITPAVTAGDRLGMMLFLGALLHGLVILGISFNMPDKEKDNSTTTLDIILVETKSKKKPEKADFLAQASQEGGGELEKKHRPRQPVQGASPVPSTNLSKTPPSPPPASQAKPKTKKIVTSKAGKDIVLSRPDKKPKPERKRISAARLINLSRDIASLTSEIDRKIDHYASRPRKKHVDASTREYRFASYIKSWTQKVERIGNLNYPDEARRQKLSGRLQLSVGIHQDGSIESITLKHSSGYAVLDDAAVRIVKLGAPYAPLPENIRKDVDILYIVRTWEFLSSNQLRGGR
ncbi:MAG: energy transducer TonB [Gammaproteobacteria bacterium]|nr:MAG: energy transducer TonB [Gammaproteobacteria bacterium]